MDLQFHIHTDHKPLKYLFSAAKPVDAAPTAYSMVSSHDEIFIHHFVYTGHHFVYR